MCSGVWLLLFRWRNRRMLVNHVTRLITGLCLCATLFGTIFLSFKRATAMQNAPPKQNAPAKRKPYDSLVSQGPKKDGLVAFVFSERDKVKLGQRVPLHYGVAFL